jgi:hypothetical protein
MAVSKSKLLKELKKRAAESERAAAALQFKIEEFCFPEQLAFALEKKIIKSACTSRRAGKCLIKGSLVATSRGSIAIENVNIGDIVYGYNKDGSISETKVLDNVYKGLKSVVDIKRGNKVLVTATKQHPFLFLDKNSVEKVTTLEKLTNIGESSIAIKKHELFSKSGKNEPFAYALGALIGDGCSREHFISISSDDYSIISKLETVLGTAHKNSQYNFTYSFKNIKHFDIPYYSDWLHNKYAHEKIVDKDVIFSWNRESQMQFLAGLLDTDGCVRYDKKRVSFEISMQALSVLEICKELISCLFQIDCILMKDNRPKYKNGPVCSIRTSNSLDTCYLLERLNPYIVCDRKKFKKEYRSLESRNKSKQGYGLTNISKPYLAECYDLEVDNDTHLYMLSNGIITHNTNTIIADFVHTCMSESNVLCLYLTLTSRSARSIIWDELKRVADKWRINVKTDETRLEMFFNDTKSTIRCGGAKDEAEIEKYRGLKLRKAYVDEAQSFRPYLRTLINDILLPGLRDLNGELGLTGTPGPVPAGPFYEYCTSPMIPNFKWNAFNNPHMHNPEGKFSLPAKDLNVRLKEERELKGITENDPSYRRETYGDWEKDENSLVFKFSPMKNLFTAPPAGRMVYIFGVDIGWNDSDAIAVLGYNYQDGNVYLIEEDIQDKQTISVLIAKIKALNDKYMPVKMVMDGGGLGKKIQEEVRQRHGLNMEVAEKHRKFEFIELMNDDLRTARMKVYKGSRFEEDTSLVVWDRSDPTKLKVSDIYHTDIGDAVLYAWRHCKHYIEAEGSIRAPKTNTQEYMDLLEQRDIEALEAKKNFNEDDNITDQDMDYIFDSGVENWDD